MKLTFAITALLMSATSALAGPSNVQDIFVDNVKTVPYTAQSCQVVQVPIYSRSNGGSAGNTLGGAVIGGAIGNQFGQGSGKEAMTILGAILGADSANRNANRQVITGYRQENQCRDVVEYREVVEKVYSHSIVTFRDKGIEYTLQFQK